MVATPVAAVTKPVAKAVATTKLQPVAKAVAATDPVAKALAACLAAVSAKSMPPPSKSINPLPRRPPPPQPASVAAAAVDDDDETDYTASQLFGTEAPLNDDDDEPDIFDDNEDEKMPTLSEPVPGSDAEAADSAEVLDSTEVLDSASPPGSPEPVSKRPRLGSDDDGDTPRAPSEMSFAGASDPAGVIEGMQSFAVTLNVDMDSLMIMLSENTALQKMCNITSTEDMEQTVGYYYRLFVEGEALAEGAALASSSGGAKTVDSALVPVGDAPPAMSSTTLVALDKPPVEAGLVNSSSEKNAYQRFCNAMRTKKVATSPGHGREVQRQGSTGHPLRRLLQGERQLGQVACRRFPPELPEELWQPEVRAHDYGGDRGEVQAPRT